MVRKIVTAFLLGLLATGGALLPAAGTAGAASGAEHRRPAGSPYTLLQMNLCLSGVAGCFGRTQYPAVVDEAIERILAEDAEAVSLNEVCSGDVARIAEETGYQMRFATVIYRGAPFSCVKPGGRGVFGNAVLTKERITDAEDHAFVAQFGVEERRWLCATTARDLTVCTSHLSTRGSDGARAANDAQCAELASVLGGYQSERPTIFGGDVNRQDSCAAAGMWTLTDSSADQLPGIQHIYSSGEGFRSPSVEVEPATYTDHDFLLAHSYLAAPPMR